MSEEYRSLSPSHHPGMQGTTPVTLKTHPDGRIEARMGFSLFGATNMDEDGYRAAQYNPFHPEFHDNYVDGFGLTDEDAIAAMKKKFNEIYESLW